MFVRWIADCLRRTASGNPGKEGFGPSDGSKAMFEFASMKNFLSEKAT